MFTNNYFRLQKLILQSTQYNRFDTTFVDTSGATTRACIGQISYLGIGNWMAYGRCRALVASKSVAPASVSSLYPGVYFGTGSTPATREDYALESPITSGLTITNGSTAYTGKAGDHSAQATYTVENTSQNDITISELGLFIPLAYDCSTSLSTSQTFNMFLMDRVVLDEPVTIPAGGVKVVAYKLTFNQS